MTDLKSFIGTTIGTTLGSDGTVTQSNEIS